VWLLFRMKKYPSAVANHTERCTFGKSILGMLGSDADPKSAVSFRLAFEPRQETLSDGPLHGRKNGKERLYKQSWLSVEAALHDGTTFSETIENFVRQRSFTNSRGKHKTKTRTQTLLAMRFDYPSETYGDLTPFRDRMHKEIQMPPGAVVRALEVSGKAVKVKAMSVSVNPSFLAQTNTMLALGVYRILNLSREIEARKRRQAGRGGTP